MTDNNLFGGGIEVKAGGSFFKFDKVGARFIGVYRGRDERPNRMDTTGKNPTQIVHEFEMIEQFDTEVNKFKKGDSVSFAKSGEPGKIMNKALENIPFGHIVGLAFTEEIPSKSPGKQAAKVVKVYDLTEDPKYKQYVSESDAIVEDAVNNMPF